MEKYNCEICGKKHSVFYGSYGSMPRKVSDMLMNEENHRIEKLSDNLQFIDNKYVIVRGQILIKTTFSENPINHEAWIELPVKDYIKQVEDAKGKSVVEINGKIATELPFYKNFTGLNAKWILEENSGFGRIQITSESKLKTDQNEPITESRMKEIMTLIHHPEILKEKKNFDISFNLRFNDIVKRVNDDFLKNDKKFLIDIGNQREILFQLISSEMLTIKSNGQIGLHISNDESNDNFYPVQKRMTSVCKSRLVEKLELDGIETYQKDYQISVSSLYEDVIYILQLVYEENIEELEIQINEI